MLSHMPVYNAMFRKDRKKRLGLHHVFLKALKAACSQSEDGGHVQARARLLKKWDKRTKWQSAKRLMKGAADR